MSLLRKVVLGSIATSFMFAADAAGFAPLGAGMVVIGAGVGIGLFALAAPTALMAFLFPLLVAISMYEVVWPYFILATPESTFL